LFFNAFVSFCGCLLVWFFFLWFFVLFSFRFSDRFPERVSDPRDGPVLLCVQLPIVCFAAFLGARRFLDAVIDLVGDPFSPPLVSFLRRMLAPLTFFFPSVNSSLSTEQLSNLSGWLIPFRWDAVFLFSSPPLPSIKPDSCALRPAPPPSRRGIYRCRKAVRVLFFRNDRSKIS